MPVNPARELASDDTAPIPRPSGWGPRIAAATALVAAAIYATKDAWSDIWHIAMRDEEASQVFLAPVVAAWLFWIRRGRIRRAAPTACWVGPLIVIVGWSLYRFGDLELYQAFWHFGAVIVAIGCVASVMGGGLLMRVLPAIGALCFLVPVPGRIRQAVAVPLQAASARVAEVLLDMAGVAVERSGSLLSINNQDVLVAEACNGLRMVFALVIVSYAFAYGVPLRNGIRVLVVALSPVTAILFNVIRLAPVIWGFGNLSPEAAESLHAASGWAMLPVAFLSLIGLLKLLRWAHIPVAPYTLAYGN